METHRIRSALNDLLEDLSEMEHQRWSHWQRYLHDQCDTLPDGSLVIPAYLAERWQSQMTTPYFELTDREKESDREQVRKYLEVIMRRLLDD
jgi:hypothetical protein